MIPRINDLLTISLQARRHGMTIAIILILALGFGLVRNVLASAPDLGDFSQELRGNDDGHDGDEMLSILPGHFQLPSRPTGRFPTETLVFFFPSLRLPPATPPPIAA